MKKGLVISVFVLSLILLSVSFASANVFSDFFGKLFGKEVLLSPSGTFIFESEKYSLPSGSGGQIGVYYGEEAVKLENYEFHRFSVSSLTSGVPYNVWMRITNDNANKRGMYVYREGQVLISKVAYASKVGNWSWVKFVDNTGDSNFLKDDFNGYIIPKATGSGLGSVYLDKVMITNDLDCNPNVEECGGSVPSVCTDSDGGYTFNVFGTVNYNGNYYSDSCNGNYLTERVCSGGVSSSFVYDCTSVGKICSDGACVETQQNITCTDSDGEDLFTKGISTGWYNSPLNDSDEFVTYEDSCYDITKGVAYVGGYVREWSCTTLGSTSDGHSPYLVPGDYPCPNGCVDGACVKVPIINETTNATCTDSDGGLDYYTKGKAYSSIQGFTQYDECDGNYVIENFCEGEVSFEELPREEGSNSFLVTTTRYLCPNGCVNGACISGNSSGPSCQSLIDNVKNPESFSEGDSEYTLSRSDNYQGNYWIDGSSESFNEYSASWSMNYQRGDDYEYGYMSKNVMVFDDSNFDAIKILEQQVEYNVCQVHGYGSDKGEYSVYVCNWDIYNRGVDVSSYDYRSVEVLWANDNILARMSLGMGKWLSDEEVNKIVERQTNQFLNALQDNRGNYIGWENFDVGYPFNTQVFNSLDSCPSQVSLDTCSPNWNCILEPIVCPEYGEQRQTCKDYQCDSKDIVNTVFCNPGICSGCIVPKWFEPVSSLGNNKCIPYGFRFENQIGWNYGGIYEDSEADKLSIAQANSDGEINLTISSNGVASLFVVEWGQNYVFSKGDTVEIDVTNWDEELARVSMYINEVFYDLDNYENSYIDITFNVLRYEKEISTIVSYCDFDGRVKPQKSKDPNSGDWATCQNNYECESNVCSNAQCYEVLDIIENANAVKKFFFKLICKIANPISDSEYSSCLVNFLG